MNIAVIYVFQSNLQNKACLTKGIWKG